MAPHLNNSSALQLLNSLSTQARQLLCRAIATAWIDQVRLIMLQPGQTIVEQDEIHSCANGVCLTAPLHPSCASSARLKGDMHTVEPCTCD